MLFPKVLSIRSRLFLMVGVGSLCGMLLLVTALFALHDFRNDSEQTAHQVERATASLLSAPRRTPSRRRTGRCRT